MTDNRNNKSDKQAYEQIGEHVRIFQRKNRWYANFQHDGKQRRPSLGTSSKKEARRRAIQLDAKISSGRYELPVQAPGIDAVIAAYEIYLKTERRSRKTLKKYAHAFKLILDLASQRKAKTILDVDLAFVDAFRAARVAGGAAPKTVHNDTVTIRQLVNFAWRRGMINEDPLKGLRLCKPKPTPQPCWTPVELDQIIGAAAEPQRSVFAVLGGTGMRIGELKFLTWDDIDFAHKVIHIRPKDDWKPKTGDVRAIPMSPVVRDVLQQLPQKSRWCFTALPSKRYPKGDHQVSERRLLQYIKRVLGRLGLKGHLHTFRHTFISNALTGGIPEAIVRQWVGHVDREILKHYTHIADAASQAAMQRLARADNHSLHEDKEVSNDHTKDSRPAQFQHKTEEPQNDDGAKQEPPTT